MQCRREARLTKVRNGDTGKGGRIAYTVTEGANVNYLAALVPLGGDAALESLKSLGVLGCLTSLCVDIALQTTLATWVSYDEHRLDCIEECIITTDKRLGGSSSTLRVAEERELVVGALCKLGLDFGEDLIDERACQSMFLQGLS